MEMNTLKNKELLLIQPSVEAMLDGASRKRTGAPVTDYKIVRRLFATTLNNLKKLIGKLNLLKFIKEKAKAAHTPQLLPDQPLLLPPLLLVSPTSIINLLIYLFIRLFIYLFILFVCFIYFIYLSCLFYLVVYLFLSVSYKITDK